MKTDGILNRDLLLLSNYVEILTFTLGLKTLMNIILKYAF